MKHVVFFLLLLVLIIVPAGHVFGEPLIPQIVPESCANSVGGCGLCDFATLAQNILNGAIFLAVFLSAVLFAYAGSKYMTAAGDSSQIKNAHKIFTNVAIGLVIILAAWLVVDTIMHTLTNTGFDQSWSSIC